MRHENKVLQTFASLMEKVGLWAEVALSELKAELRLELMSLKFFLQDCLFGPHSGVGVGGVSGVF